jgi:hypothetical protein
MTNWTLERFILFYTQSVSFKYSWLLRIQLTIFYSFWYRHVIPDLVEVFRTESQTKRASVRNEFSIINSLYALYSKRRMYSAMNCSCAPVGCRTLNCKHLVSFGFRFSGSNMVSYTRIVSHLHRPVFNASFSSISRLRNICTLHRVSN